MKLADIADNIRNIAELDPDFAAVYLREKAACLEVLREGDAALVERVGGLLREQQRLLA